MDREKMINSILLFISLMFYGSFPLKVYQAEENQNITLEWIFPTLTNRPTNSYTVYCEVFTSEWPIVLLHLHNGVEVPHAQHEHFRGRVHCDRDALRDGRLRLEVSRLRTDDSSVYGCQVIINMDVSFSECRLNVTTAMVRPKPEGPNATNWGWIVLYSGLPLMAVLAAAVLAVFCHKRAVPTGSEESLSVI